MTPVPLPIQFSEAALAQIQQTFTSKNLPIDYALRIGLKGAGCGASYLLGLDKASPQDEIFDIANIKVLIDRRHLMYLYGIVLDFEDGEEGQGFFFEKI
jgi:iron-sulfur cluster assembly protein